MDKTFEEEQHHLSEVYATICSLRDELTADLPCAVFTIAVACQHPD